MQKDDSERDYGADRQEKGVLDDNDFKFLREKIKERPINRRKLLRRTVITASMAVFFAVVACFTFLILEPVFSNWLYPEEEPKEVTFPEVEEEMLPEDMQQTEQSGVPDQTGQEQTEAIEKELEITDFQLLYNKLYGIAQNAMKSMVMVTGVTSDVDWLNNTFESKGQTSGFIIKNDGKELLILASKKAVEEAETIRVTFSDDTQATATVKASDPSTGLSVIGIPLLEIPEETVKKIAVAALGGSNLPGLTGSPVVVVGSPAGPNASVAYGMLSSAENKIDVVDNAYTLMTTDIYGSSAAAGAVLDMQGQIIGIIDMNYNGEDTKNLISAIGITELKKTIDKLSRGLEMAFLGIYGNDVTEEANKELGVPFGAYVKQIEMESPAMRAGIQGGDVIVKIGTEEIANMSDYISVLLNKQPGDTVNVTVLRQGKEEYQEMTFEITFDTYQP